ncbi:hypothetical protein I656_01617 [Geobacillus sp. WSUCF1]|nr:hypothetical protein I656_01617 [Geobacillus sp. WSUCF1]
MFSVSESTVLTMYSDDGSLVIKKALAAFVCASVSFVIAAESATYIHRLRSSLASAVHRLATINRH